MKKILMAAAIAALLPMAASAQSAGLFSKRQPAAQKDMTEYLKKGAVPVTDGKVTFTSTFANTADKEQTIKKLMQWADLRYQPNTEHGVWNDADYYKNLENPSVRTGEGDVTMTCTGHEELVFSNRTLAKDYCTATYTLKINVGEKSTTATISNIVYTYSLGETPERIAAEDWITDEEAINKKGRLLRVSGKFRIKTIDLKNELFKEIAEQAGAAQ